MATLKIKDSNGNWQLVGAPTEEVRYTTQVLTEEQKTQARTNIGAAHVEHSHTVADIGAVGIKYYGGDIDTLFDDGFYRVATNENLPDDLYYGQIIVSKGLVSDTVVQIGVSYMTGKMYSRGANIVDGTANWSAWNDVRSEIGEHDGDSYAHEDIRLAVNNASALASQAKDIASSAAPADHSHTAADIGAVALTNGETHDCNSAITVGLWRCFDTTVNTPITPFTGDILSVANWDQNTIFQMYYTNRNGGKVYFRFSNTGNANNWESWKEFVTAEHITYGTSDLTAGSSPLETGKLYFVYE